MTGKHGAAVSMKVVSGEAARSLTLKAPEGCWDLSAYLYVAVELRNAGAEETLAFVEVNSRGAEAWSNRNDAATVLLPGEQKTLKALIVRLPLGPDSALGRFFAGPTGVIGGEYSSGMLGLPGGFTWHWNRIDPSQVVQVVVWIPYAKGGEVVEVGGVAAEGEYAPPTEAELRHGFVPFVDGFGQYRHREWPGKVHSVQDTAQAREAETADLEAHPGPLAWNQYGGWAAGPQLEATGFFRPAMHQGKWWLVDPEGRLFWSHGIDCVGFDWGTTRIGGREHYFAELPEPDSPLAAFYTGSGERRGYRFGQANLWRKYGEEWRAIGTDLLHRRLRSWGMNTIGNWSSPEIYLKRRTPYVVAVHYASRNIEGSEKLPDPFDPGFRTALRAQLREAEESANDPWCIGYFVDNELDWQRDADAALLVARAPADQMAKRELMKDLRARYQDVGSLNAAWGTNHASWESLLQCREAPDKERSYRDLAAFFRRMAQTYFRTCREEVKAAAANTLYLGCRIHNPNPHVVPIAAEYCDVVSFNCYRYDVRTFELPAGLDVPIIIGEWHFGALDRGPLHPGLRHVQDQSERAVLYKSYVRSALDHPLLVGTHWFQYTDQSTTGRDDGENCQNGFVDICDRPYGETVEASREVGYAMYERRLEGRP
ncbi:MAG: beta-agarase [Armatimonadota bacterium]